MGTDGVDEVCCVSIPDLTLIAFSAQIETVAIWRALAGVARWQSAHRAGAARPWAYSVDDKESG